MSTRVLLVAPSSSGGEGVYTNLIQQAAPPGVTYSVSKEFKQGAPGARCAVGTEVALNRLLRPRAIPDIGFRAVKLRESFDLIHVHAHPVRLTGLSSTPVVMSEGSSSVVYLRDYLGWTDERIAGALSRAGRLYKTLGIHDRLLETEHVDRVYVFSRWARDLNLSWGADPSKLDVLPPGFPAPRPAQREGRDTFTFLFVGGDFERKGGFDVIEAFSRISGDLPQARLVLAGCDPGERNPDRLVHGWVGAERRARLLAELEGLVARGVAGCTGRQTSKDLAGRVYPEGDAFVMPSLAEGFGFTNVEAMSHGLPVISTRVGPIPEIVTHEESGLLVEPGDVGGLAEAMARLASDVVFARKLGAHARDVFMREYTIEEFRARLGAFYASVLDG
ncbi:MAG: glycosyltransferase family 4 protein [Actinomycetota bacterium]|nr:glycosyltransferase family 4 protein [Actinomycetota bacterium]